MAETTEYVDTAPEISQDSIGRVMIADDVIAIIAGFAATETKGVASMAGHITNEIVGKLAHKNLQKGVKVETVDGVVTVDVNLYLEYGYSIPKVCAMVQDKIKTAIETMTGLEVKEVNIQIAGVNVENTK